jgi:metallo-beta-lactamase family protein
MKITIVGAAGGEVTGSAYYVQTTLLKWFSAIAPSRPRVILTHGEDEPRAALARKIQQQFKLSCRLPDMGEMIEL